jgi:stalled ribosome alternative rescue factor ArfA
MTVAKLALSHAAQAVTGNADPALIRAPLSEGKQKTRRGKGSQARGESLDNSATVFKTRLP